MNTQTVDTVNDDGSVTRTITQTITFSAKDYQKLVDIANAQIEDLQAQVTPMRSTLQTVLSTQKVVA